MRVRGGEILVEGRLDPFRRDGLGALDRQAQGTVPEPHDGTSVLFSQPCAVSPGVEAISGLPLKRSLYVH